MMWKWINRRTGRTYHSYSIGEKIRYFNEMLHSNNPKKRQKAKSRLEYLQSNLTSNKVFGKVFMAKDQCFYSNANPNKSRRVVAIGIKDNVMKVIPVNKHNKVVHLSGFDGKRALNVNRVKDLSLDDIHYKHHFPMTSNDRLTTKEKEELKRKLNR